MYPNCSEVTLIKFIEKAKKQKVGDKTKNSKKFKMKDFIDEDY